MGGAASPALEVRVTVFYGEDIRSYVYDIHLSLKQTVTTNRGERVSAATWEAGVAGIAGTNEMPEAVKGRINHLVDVFLKAYHAENLRKE